MCPIVEATTKNGISLAIGSLITLMGWTAGVFVYISVYLLKTAVLKKGLFNRFKIHR